MRLPGQAAVASAAGGSPCCFEYAVDACPLVPGIDVLLIPLQAESAITATNGTEAFKICFTT
jgi:hypothetical protein